MRTRLFGLLTAAAAIGAVGGCSSRSNDGGGGAHPPEPGPASSHAATENAMTMTTPTSVHLEAVVRIPGPGDELHPGKKFAGVLLEADDGTVWVASYRADPLWLPFGGERVVVDGERVTPKGQALSDPHIAARSWKLADAKSMARFVSVGPIEEVEGRFGEHVGAPGTKEEGERTLTLAIGGTSYSTLNTPADPGARPLRIRRVELSPFSAHGGGDIWLWFVAPE